MGIFVIVVMKWSFIEWKDVNVIKMVYIIVIFYFWYECKFVGLIVVCFIIRGKIVWKF